MKTMAFILANIMLFALGVSSATSAPCGNEIDSLSKILAAKDAGSGSTAWGAASGTPIGREFVGPTPADQHHATTD